MKLLLDIGNTRIKWAFDSGQALQSPGEILHRGQSSAVVAELLTGLPHVPTAAYALNVAGQGLENTLREALAARCNIELQMVRATRQCGEVVNGYTDVAQLGVDRWAAIVGGWQRARRRVCVVDAGTAVTIDLAEGDGRHLGGVIVPGIELMHSVLDRDTSNIEEFSGRSDTLATDGDWFGRNTRAAVARGTLLMLAALIDRAVDEFSRNGAVPALYMTGGDAPLLAPLVRSRAEIRPLLVLEGLQHLVGAAD